jgi:hypothetical protein
MNIHISSDENAEAHGTPERAERVKLHYHVRSVKEYIDYVVDHQRSKSIAIVGKICGCRSRNWTVLTLRSLCGYANERRYEKRGPQKKAIWRQEFQP